VTPLDPDCQLLLDMARQAGRPAFETAGHLEARTLFKSGFRVLAPDPLPVAEIRDLSLPGPAGAIAARLYRGVAAPLLPGLVYFHGGGWVIGDIETHEPVCRHLAHAAGCAVVSVDYRLAPEHKFPAAVEDCVAATEWVAANAATLGLDPARLAVGGDSAGGNLAAVVALTARDRVAPRLSLQLLIYPATDFGGEFDSYQRYAEGYLLTTPTMRWFVEQYLGDAAAAADWRASPLRAPDLRGVAPAYVLTAGYDPLCDEGDAYARRLQEHGIAVQHRRYADQLHGFISSGGIIRAAHAALDECAAALKSSWGLVS
jgi:acetyl esterase